MSSLDVHLCCLLQSVHPCPLIVTLIFLSLVKIRYAKLFSSFSLVISRGFFGSTTLQSWNYCNYFWTASLPFCINIWRPYLILYLVRMVSFVIIIVGKVGLTKLLMTLTTLTLALATLWRSWAPKIRFLHPMDFQVDLS